jgi:hypothetical protein
MSSSFRACAPMRMYGCQEDFGAEAAAEADQTG